MAMGLFVGERQREEAPRLREGLVHQRAIDAVMHDVEEADVPTGDPDLLRKGRRRGSVLAPFTEVDDG